MGMEALERRKHLGHSSFQEAPSRVQMQQIMQNCPEEPNKLEGNFHHFMSLLLRFTLLRRHRKLINTH